MSFTDEDRINADKYTKHRLTLEYMNKMHEKYPHITSWLEYEIKQADPDLDYYYPKALEDQAIVVNTHINFKLCEEKLSCNPLTGTTINNGMCTVDQRASLYRIGDVAQFDGVQCQPSCYHLKHRNSPDDTSTQMPLLKYNEMTNECAIVNVQLLAFMEFPYFRSKTIYEHRVNDLPTGFNRSSTISRDTISGISYEYNKIYCDAFFDKFNDQSKICYSPWYEVMGNAIIGETIIKLCKSAHQASINNGSDLPSTSNLPNPPPIDQKYHLENWLKDINRTFELPKINIKISDLKDGIFRTSGFYQDNKSTLKSYNAEISATARRQLEAAKKMDITDKSINTRKRRFTETPLIPSDSKTLQFFMSILGPILNPALWRDLAIFIGTEKLASLLKDIGIYMVKELQPKLLTALTDQVFDMIFTDIMRITVKNIASSLITKFCADITADLIAVLNPVTAFIKIALALVIIMDLVLSIIDPLNYNKKYPPGYLDMLMQSSEIQLQKQFKNERPILSFDLLVMLLLSKEEIGEISLHSLIHYSHYLQSLTVNSDGVKIDRGEKKNASSNIDKYIREHTEEMNKIHLYGKDDVDNYEIDHMRRIKLIERIKWVIWCSGAGLIATVILHLPVLMYILIFVICASIYCQHAAVGIKNINNIAGYFHVN